MTDDLERVWKALADATRRAVLDLLREGPLTTTEIVEQFPELSRFGVMKHLDVLREAGLIVTRVEGRRRINSLNAVPIRMIYERWVSNYEALWASTLLRVKEDAEGADRSQAKSTSAGAQIGHARIGQERVSPDEGRSSRSTQEKTAESLAGEIA